MSIAGLTISGGSAACRLRAAKRISTNPRNAFMTPPGRQPIRGLDDRLAGMVSSTNGCSARRPIQIGELETLSGLAGFNQPVEAAEASVILFREHDPEPQGALVARRLG